jgi:serine/threonine-protein kinase OSR1/STK39
MAPEVLQDDKGHTEKADIWSLGITAIELATGAAPYATLKELDVVQKILKAPPPQLPRGRAFSSEYRDFVKKCMNFDPRRRPSAPELLDHPFLQQASEPSYIVDYLLKGLPPLGARYEGFKMSLSGFGEESRSISPSSSCPPQIQWTFRDDWDVDHLEKKGRFTIQRSAPRPEAQETPPTDPHDDRISRLAVRVEQLELENREMRRQLDLLTALVMKVVGQT